MIILTGPQHSKCIIRKIQEKYITLRQLVNELDSRQNVVFDLGAGVDFMSKMCRIDEN